MKFAYLNITLSVLVLAFTSTAFSMDKLTASTARLGMRKSKAEMLRINPQDITHVTSSHDVNTESYYACLPNGSTISCFYYRQSGKISCELAAFNSDGLGVIISLQESYFQLLKSKFQSQTQ